MILNSKNNQFVFKLPKGFIPEDVEDKYNHYLRRLPTPFENILDYVNHTVQSVTFPGVNADTVEQMVGRRTQVEDNQGPVITKNPQTWRQSQDIRRVFPKEFTVNFKASDGYLNYWVLWETFSKYLEITNKEDYFRNLQLQYLDYFGYQLLTIELKQPLMTSISEVEMNYSATALEFRTIAVGFKFNDIEIKIFED